jgi:hypothetical protein
MITDKETDYMDEDGNYVEVSFQMQAQLFADDVLESLNAQRSILERETDYLTRRIAKLNELLAEEEEKYLKGLLTVQIELAEDSIGYLADRLTELGYSKMATEIAREFIVEEPKGWMLAPGEHEEWISHHRARIAKAIGDPRGN